VISVRSSSEARRDDSRAAPVRGRSRTTVLGGYCTEPHRGLVSAQGPVAAAQRLTIGSWQVPSAPPILGEIDLILQESN
jgi:hypothetical protein